MGNQARDIVFKSARESWSDCRHRIGSLGIAPQAWQMNDFHDAMNESLEWFAPRRQAKRRIAIPVARSRILS